MQYLFSALHILLFIVIVNSSLLHTRFGFGTVYFIVHCHCSVHSYCKHVNVQCCYNSVGVQALCTGSQLTRTIVDIVTVYQS